MSSLLVEEEVGGEKGGKSGSVMKNSMHTYTAPHTKTHGKCSWNICLCPRVLCHTQHMCEQHTVIICPNLYSTHIYNTIQYNIKSIIWIRGSECVSKWIWVRKSEWELLCKQFTQNTINSVPYLWNTEAFAIGNKIVVWVRINFLNQFLKLSKI